MDIWEAILDSLLLPVCAAVAKVLGSPEAAGWAQAAASVLAVAVALRIAGKEDRRRSHEMAQRRTAALFLADRAIAMMAEGLEKWDDHGFREFYVPAEAAHWLETMRSIQPVSLSPVALIPIWADLLHAFASAQNTLRHLCNVDLHATETAWEVAGLASDVRSMRDLRERLARS